MSPSSGARPLAYFDTSALIKLLVGEPGSGPARAVWRRTPSRAASQIAYPEARAALAAARRSGRLSTAGHRTGVRRLGELLAMVAQIPAAPGLLRRAGELADRHALRGYDAVHLASALAAGPGVIVVSFDRALREAASAAGLAAARLKDQSLGA